MVFFIDFFIVINIMVFDVVWCCISVGNCCVISNFFFSFKKFFGNVFFDRVDGIFFLVEIFIILNVCIIIF